MSEKNQELISLLNMAYQTCNAKLAVIKEGEHLPASELQPVEDSVQQLFKDFSLPELWMAPIPYNEDERSKLMEFIVGIQMIKADAPQKFVENVNGTIAFLRQRILARAQSLVKDVDDSGWNQAMRDQMLQMRKTIRLTKFRFINQGHDLDNDPECQKQDQRFKELYKDYWDKLMSGEVESNKEEVTRMSMLQKHIKLIQQLSEFLKAYAQLNDLIAEQSSVKA